MDSFKNIKFIYQVIKIQNHARRLPEIVKAYSARTVYDVISSTYIYTVGTTEVGISGGPPFWLIE